MPTQATRARKSTQRPHHRAALARNRRHERAGRKKRLWPSQRQEAVRASQQRGIPTVRACKLLSFTRSNLYYRRLRKDDGPVTQRLHELAQERPRWGWRRLFIIVRRREGHAIGETRFRRIYRELQLQVRPRKKRKVTYVRGASLPPAFRLNERWSIDFMHDRLANGRTYRALTITDDFTKECLALELAHSFGSADVIRVFEAIAFERGLPQTVRFDNGPEFTSHAMLRWAAERRVHLHFIQPGKPTQNANIESLNGKIRDELFNLHSFTNIFEARHAAEKWRLDFNEVRPHSAIGYQTPREFAENFKWPEIQRYHEQGHSVRECCEKFGFSIGGWYRARAKGRVRTISGSKYNKRYDWAEVQAYYDQGHSWAACVRKFRF
ncbi:MAG TPA: IS3 family transposase [Candidatus Rubrimentiphilum sp.]|nr:IS3 family transposase [Candidatus Rubrimentiphilum sp.]